MAKIRFVDHNGNPRGPIIQFINTHVPIVINGSGESGKDTFVDIISKHYGVKNVSSIDPIKEIAKQMGWDGTKDDKSRKFLSDMKKLSIEYNDYPTEYIYKEFNLFNYSTDAFFFAHIREPEEIEKFKQRMGGKVITVLIKRENSTTWNNTSDSEVEDYNYDYIIENNGTLEDLREAADLFIKDAFGGGNDA